MSGPPLDAETAVHGLLADVAEARAQLAEVTAERDRLRNALTLARTAAREMADEFTTWTVTPEDHERIAGWRQLAGLDGASAGSAGDHALAGRVRAVIARYRADDVNALTAFADIMDAAGDTARSPAARGPDAATLEAAARHFAEAWRELLPDLPDSYACHLNCAEANAAAELYQALGDEATAAAILAAHVEHDDEEEATTHDDAAAETASILADPETMTAIAEGDPDPSVLRDLLSLAGEDIPLDRIAGWSPEDCAKAAEWAGREHLSASDNPVGRRERPSVLEDIAREREIADDIATRGLDHWGGQHDDD